MDFPYNDPALRGHYCLRYFAYVKDRIVNEIPKITNTDSLHPGNVPSPTDPRLNILDFDTWAKSPEGSYSTIDPEDNKPAFEYLDANGKNPHERGEFTKLDKALMNRFEEAKNSLLNEFGNDLVPGALEDYFTRGATDPMNGNYDENVALNLPVNELGQFVIFSSNGSLFEADIWSDTDLINRTAGSRRSVQIRLMNEKVQQFLTYALDTVPGRDRFFRKSQSILDKIKIFYSKVKYKIFGP